MTQLLYIEQIGAHDNHEQIEKVYDISTNEIQMGKNKLGELYSFGLELENWKNYYTCLNSFVNKYK